MASNRFCVKAMRSFSLWICQADELRIQRVVVESMPMPLRPSRSGGGALPLSLREAPHKPNEFTKKVLKS